MNIEETRQTRGHEHRRRRIRQLNERSDENENNSSDLRFWFSPLNMNSLQLRSTNNRKDWFHWSWKVGLVNFERNVLVFSIWLDDFETRPNFIVNLWFRFCFVFFDHRDTRIPFDYLDLEHSWSSSVWLPELELRSNHNAKLTVHEHKHLDNEFSERFVPFRRVGAKWKSFDSVVFCVFDRWGNLRRPMNWFSSIPYRRVWKLKANVSSISVWYLDRNCSE